MSSAVVAAVQSPEKFSVDVEGLNKEVELLRAKVEQLTKENQLLLQAIKEKNERLLSRSRWK
ncbi:MAG: hypothetical protein ACP5O3_02150 [Candidatus Micrarchaeia archaeon]|jgi:predicted ATP-grasp superfamily ATP-dependent carboligase